MLYIFFNFSSTVFTVFVLFLILYCLFFLCDRVDNVSFVGEQEQAYEEDFQQLAEEGKWPSPSVFYPINIMVIHVTLLLYCINLMG